VDIFNKSEWLTNASYFYNIVGYSHPEYSSRITYKIYVNYIQM